MIVFGLIGGYIRYLYKTSRLVDINKEKNTINNIKIERTTGTYLDLHSQDIKRNIFFESIERYCLIFSGSYTGDSCLFLIISCIWIKWN